MKRLLLASVAALATLGLAGCASTSVTQLWRDPSYRSRPASRVFVVAAMPGNANPAQFESALAQALTAKGFQATTRSSLFPPGRIDRNKVQEYVNGNGVDLLVMERLTTEAAAPVAVTTTVSQSSGWYGAYGGATATSTTISQGTDVSARIEVFDVRTEPDTLIWSGQSNAVDLQDAAQSLSAALTSELIKAQILVK
jgi:curli biogenesis system outer membrane secretion channel CsgG